MLVALFVMVCLVGLILLRLTLLVVTVEYDSMAPTLAHGDRVLVLRLWPRRWLRRGQIVIVTPWKSTRHGGLRGEDLFIKRIVGMPGETLVTSLTELDDFHRRREAAAHDAAGKRTWHIPAGYYFVRGDHAIGGHDSLSWGPLPAQAVRGIVILTRSRQRASGRAATPLSHSKRR